MHPYKSAVWLSQEGVFGHIMIAHPLDGLTSG